MKTKSKRFLNLATLCLALLGTALLMGCPVKAETEAEVQGISRDTDPGLKDTIRERYMDQMRIGPDELEQPDFKNRFEGYFQGYSDGLNEFERPGRNEIVVPEEHRDGRGDVEYKDGYQWGFEEGRREARPIAAFFEAVWQVLTDIFGSWFGGGQQS